MVKIFAIDKKTKIREEIIDLYWFEENHVHGFDNDLNYDFEIMIADTVVYKSGDDSVMHEIRQNSELNYWNAKKMLERAKLITDALGINTT